MAGTRIAIGCDHGGVDLKDVLVGVLKADGMDVTDVGTHGTSSVDYPDFAKAVSESVSAGETDQGILICTTGIGMSIAANRYPGIRAALCSTPELAVASRNHNNANVLCLGAGVVSEEQAAEIVDVWLKTEFSIEDRHARRVSKFGVSVKRGDDVSALASADPDLCTVIEDEVDRQQSTLDLIASENNVSRAVRQAQGSVLTNKYAEGYPGKRWYNGCGCVDEVESLAIERAKEIFGADHANVQPHCGSSANMAAYFSVLEPGDTVVAMSLADGGHLTHGHPLNFSGRLYNFVPYGVSRESEQIDYDELARLVDEHKPRMIVAGASAYPRILDFERFREIADRVGAYLLVDMAHIAGLIAGGVHPNPVPYSDFVTTTTHKTLCGPRSGMVLCREEFAEAIDKAVFPGLQGGPLMHVIAAKAVCFHEAMQPAFKDYSRQVVANARAMADVFTADGLRLVSGGTDNHLMLVDVSGIGTTGKAVAIALEKAGIVANKNAIPFDTKSPFVTSGVRLGTPGLTGRGMKESDVASVATLIASVVRNIDDESVIARVKADIGDLCRRFPAE